MRGGMAIYLGAEDMTMHSATCCADSAMMFPLGYVEGLSISIDPQRLAANLPEALQEANFQPQKLFAAFCQESPLRFLLVHHWKGYSHPYTPRVLPCANPTSSSKSRNCSYT